MNNFSPSETQCRCGCGLDVKPLILAKINAIRTLYGKRIYLTCGARCESHNKAVGGAPASAHLSGEAVDIVRDEALLTLIKDKLSDLDLYMEDPNSTPTWIHIQTRPTVNRIFTPYITKQKTQPLTYHDPKTELDKIK